MPLAVVTGASSGIGRGIAVHLAEHGWDVAFCYVTDDVGAEDTSQQIYAHGQRSLAKRCDVGDAEQVDAFFDAIDSTFDNVPTLLVNNAGVQTWSPLLDLDLADWTRTLRTNLTGTFLCTQHVGQRLRDAGLPGSIVNIGSASNKVPFPKLVDYTASKGGIEMFTKVAAAELGPLGIRVNCVAPGAIEIERTRRESPDYAETWGALAPMGRVGTPLDIAHVVAFLGSEASTFVTGQTLYVDGGAFTLPNWPY
ncbi:MAG: SDR family oxidoreductase [Rhodothermales bacterium]